MRRASQDGTTIGFDRTGEGRPLILIDGALTQRGMGPNSKLAERLSSDFTVYTYDRRGRGESTDTAPYAVAREIEDIAALIDAAGGSAHLYGISSGGALALEAASRLPDMVSKVAVYEIPYVVDDSRPPVPDDFRDRLEHLLAKGERGGAVRLFMRDAAGLPAVLVAAMPLFPGWSKNKAVAHTLPYDAEIMRGGQAGWPLPAARWAAASAPTLVASGGKSPAWVRNASARLAATLPNAQEQTLAGQRHYVRADALAPVLTEFFGVAHERVAGTGRGATRALGTTPVA